MANQVFAYTVLTCRAVGFPGSKERQPLFPAKETFSLPFLVPCAGMQAGEEEASPDFLLDGHGRGV